MRPPNASKPRTEWGKEEMQKERLRLSSHFNSSRKEGREGGSKEQTAKPGDLAPRSGQAPRVLNCDYSPVSTPHPMASG